MRLLCLISLFCLLGMGEKPVSSVVLKNGKEVKTLTKPIIEKNMIAFTDVKGRKVLISKGLIDWEATREKSLLVYQLAYPKEAKLWLANRKSVAKSRPRKKIVITNDILEAMSPSEGLAGEWNSMPSQPADSAAVPSSSGGRTIIKTISHGKTIDLKRHMEPGRYVIFDFYADWCGPCRKLTPQLEKLVRKYPSKLALKKVDIIKWGTPVANQFNIRSIPYVEVYDAKGRQKLKGNGFRVLSDLKKKARKEKW